MVGLFLSLVPQAWGEQYYLYSPRPMTAEEAKGATDGILVREVEVRRGDTLSRIARNSSGHGAYYPQILLFNDIKNPNLIHTGDTLKIPVATAQTAGAEGAAPVRRKRRDAHKAARSHKANTVAARSENPPAAEAKPVVASKPEQRTAIAQDAAAGQQLFERAVKAYRQGECRTALDLFDRFLTTYPKAHQAADASLYKADCYLKLSGQ